MPPSRRITNDMTNQNFHQRKHPRLKCYDYSSEGCYFVTVCVCRADFVLSSVIDRGPALAPEIILTSLGKITEKHIFSIEDKYENVSVERYAILPDHVHILLNFQCPSDGGLGAARPTLQRVIKGTKAMITREFGQSVWQDSFYDEVIKSEEHYLRVWSYIDSNAQKWLLSHK